MERRVFVARALLEADKGRLGSEENYLYLADAALSANKQYRKPKLTEEEKETQKAQQRIVARAKYVELHPNSISKEERRRRSLERTIKITNLAAEGVSYLEIGKQFNIGRDRAYQIAERGNRILRHRYLKDKRSPAWITLATQREWHIEQ